MTNPFKRREERKKDFFYTVQFLKSSKDSAVVIINSQRN